MVNLLSDRVAVTCGGESPVDMIWSGLPSERLITATMDGSITLNGYGVLLQLLFSFMEKFPIVMSQEFLVTISVVPLMVILSSLPS